ncbi:5-hydroxytryptamine receptor 1A-like isoform X2 [Leptidea sinapis]|nr:5-hydroxytryptamine receptor 1A-like isoform X2 [Leptidea sinapis]
MIGLTMLIGAVIENPLSSDPMCIFLNGMLVCPAMVSIFSVGLIAIDRYIYILHGLYYQRWVDTTKVRISICIVWVIGLTLGFLPVTGWKNRELSHSHCYYVALFPGALILLNSILSIVPIVVVAVLYTIILIKALKKVKEINAGSKSTPANKQSMRLYKGNTNFNKNHKAIDKIRRSSSFNGSVTSKKSEELTIRSMSIDNFKEISINSISIKIAHKLGHESANSISTLNSSVENSNVRINNDPKYIYECESGPKDSKKAKAKEATKWRAVYIVMLTTGSFVCTWIPFFITVIFFVFCEQKLTNPKCLQLRMMLGGPLAALAFLNSIFNPLIYAWWHKGFQRNIKMYYKSYLNKILFCKTKTAG